jgi:hypothetical protein
VWRIRRDGPLPLIQKHGSKYALLVHREVTTREISSELATKREDSNSHRAGHIRAPSAKGNHCVAS